METIMEVIFAFVGIIFIFMVLALVVTCFGKTSKEIIMLREQKIRLFETLYNVYEAIANIKETEVIDMCNKEIRKVLNDCDRLEHKQQN